MFTSGIIAGVMAVDSAPVVFDSMVFFDSSTSNRVNTITLPDDIEDDDVIIIMNATSGFSAPAAVIPSGYTEITGARYNGASTRFIASYKLATTADSLAVVTVMNPGYYGSGTICLVLRPNAPVSGVSWQSSWNFQAINGDPTTQSIPVSGQTGVIAAIGIAYELLTGDYSSSLFTTFSPTPDAVVLNSINEVLAGVKLFDTADSHVDVSVDVGTSAGSGQALESGWIKFV